MSRVPALAMQTAVVSEPGPRKNNEDAVCVSPRLVAVADGVGGAAAGEVASGSQSRKMLALAGRRLEQRLELELSAAVADANAVIEFVISYDPELAGMGTTLTAVALSNDGDYLIANVGDWPHPAAGPAAAAPDPRPQHGADADRRGGLSEEDARAIRSARSCSRLWTACGARFRRYRA